MTGLRAAVAAGIITLLAVSGCTASSGGAKGGGPASGAPATSPSAPASNPVAGSGGRVSGSSAPVSGTSAPVSGTSAPAAPIPTTAPALRTFVLAGQRVDAARYGSSAATAGDPLRANPGGELTVELPSGNISCDLRPVATTTSAETLCWVQVLAQRAPRPASCGHDWVPGIADLIASRVAVGACLGGIPFGQYAKVLPYGSTIVLGAMGCRSDPRFVACADLRTGAGFRADRTAITVVRA